MFRTVTEAVHIHLICLVSVGQARLSLTVCRPSTGEPEELRGFREGRYDRRYLPTANARQFNLIAYHS